MRQKIDIYSNSFKGIHKMFCKGFLSFQGSTLAWFEPGEHNNTICKLTKPPISNCTHICSPATMLWEHLGHRIWTMEGIWGKEFGLWKLGKPFTPSDHWFTEWSLVNWPFHFFLCQDQTLSGFIKILSSGHVARGYLSISIAWPSWLLPDRLVDCCLISILIVWPSWLLPHKHIDCLA